MQFTSLATRIFVILLGILTAIVVYWYLVQPYILEPLCLVNSNSCARIGYYRYNNSALMEMKNSGLYVWYNGDKAFVYGQPVGQICDKNYEAAYAVNTHTGLKEGYACVMLLKDVIKFYTDKGIKMENTVVKANVEEFDVYALLNYASSIGIINLQSD